MKWDRDAIKLENSDEIEILKSCWNGNFLLKSTDQCTAHWFYSLENCPFSICIDLKWTKNGSKNTHKNGYRMDLRMDLK